MFKSKVKQRRIFSNRRRVRRRFSGIGAIASVALFLLVLELLTRIFIDVSGNRSQFAQTEGESDSIEAYQLNFDASSPSSSSKQQDSLRARSTISVGYELMGNQQSDYWQINEQGFRDRDPVPLVKPANEVRIFVLGGSTAFGYGNASNSATISAQLEARLQQRLQQQKTSPQLYKPDLLPADPEEKQKYLAKPSKIKSGNYRVINAAVPGYASGNELAQVALQILKYKPDLIVTLDGYTDLMLKSDRQATTIPQANYLANKPKSIEKNLAKWSKLLKNNSYLAQIAQNYWLSSQETDSKADFLLNEQTSNLVKHLPTDETELQNRIDRYIEHQKQILNLSAAARVPLVMAIQPEITGRNPRQLTDIEGAIATDLGRTYIKKVRESYPVFTQASVKLAQAYPQNIKVVDLYKLTDKYPSPSFIDAIHLNKAANEKVAEQLYYAISNFSKMQVIPKQAVDPIKAPKKLS